MTTPEYIDHKLKTICDMDQELAVLEGKLIFWRILAGGLFLTIIALLCLWP